MGKLAVWLGFICAGVISLAGCQPNVSGSGEQARKGSRIIAIPDKEVCLDQGTQLMWQVAWSRKRFASGDQAQAYVRQLNTGGHSDWRLPTNREIYVLNEIMDMSIKSDCEIQLHGNYWMKNKDGAHESGNWEIYPLCGSVEYRYNKNPGKKAKVRAVRDAGAW